MEEEEEEEEDVLLLRESARFAARAAAANAAARGQPLLAVLADELGLDPASVLPLLAAALSLPLASVSDILAWRAAFEVLPFADCLRYKIVPMRDADGALRMLTGDPLYLDLRTVIEERLSDPAQWMLTPPDEIEALLARHEETVHALESSGSDAGVPAGSDE